MDNGIDQEKMAALRQKDERIRAAIARGERESVWSHLLRHPGSTLSSVLYAVWPAGIVGAAIGGGLALVLHFVFSVNAQFLILIGFIIGWGRSFWEYVSSAWFAELRMNEKDEESGYAAATSDELYRMIVLVLIVFRQTASLKTPAGFRNCLNGLQTYVDVRRVEDKKRLDHSQRAYVQAVRERCLLKIDDVCDIIDRLIPAIDVPDLPVARQLYGQLDGVFRPPDGGDSWDVLTRTAASAE